MSIYNSQACQDLFVEKITRGKRDGYFLEIGSNHPQIHSNTYLLEKHYNWKGLMVEYDHSYKPLYDEHRKNSIYAMNDARIINYREILDTNNFPNNIDYLQVDLDVDNKSTLDTLMLLDNTVFDKYKFATITFEHDIYTGNFFNTREISRKILSDRGYVLLFPDVRVDYGGWNPFEDWYVHPDLVDHEIINKCKTEDSLKSEEIKELLNKLY